MDTLQKQFNLLYFFRFDFNSNETLPDSNAEYELIHERKVIVEKIHISSLVEHTRCGECGSGIVKESAESHDIPVGVKYTYICPGYNEKNEVYYATFVQI